MKDINVRKKIYLKILILLVFLWTVFFIFILYNNRVQVRLNGSEYIDVSVNSTYIDQGFIIIKNNKKVHLKRNKYNVSNDVDVNKIGKYSVSYKFNYMGKYYNLKRTVNVVDDVKPEIIVDTMEIERDYCTKGNVTDFSYSAKDNYDGDITKRIEYKEIDNYIVLEVSDSSNNKAIKKIPIKYIDIPESNFTLNGNEKMFVTVNNNYKEFGAKYIDGCGNDLSDDIKISGTVNTKTIGEYKIKYKFNNEELVRTVNVYEPNVSNNDKINKIIYLTFDDGPGYYTNKVLDTLDKYGIKATFFVTHQFNNYVHLIKEEDERGHVVGVHTYTHNWDIYTDLDTYLDDFNKMNDTIKEYTGHKTKIFRFPGGSSNTISRGIKKGIISEIADRMNNDGYVYFDWNIDSNDASSASDEQIYNNVVNGVIECDNCVVLMHDIKSTTANVLDNILDNLTMNGYKFGVLNENTPVVHHRINN